MVLSLFGLVELSGLLVFFMIASVLSYLERTLERTHAFN